MDIEFVRADIEQRRRQIARQRKEILDLQRAGISTKSAEELLARMLNKVDELRAERDRLKDKSIANVAGPAPCLARFLPKGTVRAPCREATAGSNIIPTRANSVGISTSKKAANCRNSVESAAEIRRLPI
ncbi:hypothetical protein D6B98_00110 [Bradyrhizobium sp. LVM 105]|uniref:Uncharacterized protein n=1 Tax=Bradyrhizobium frederickii TaxID=2560054 RepID=A0A4Y9KW99_9BRAD|nr:hypothetical protein D6B98_00110 [Bradyrhizobium sp. LVM 105]TFV30660.1 hypothetical protein E4K66_33975 [Bradyrhizobium frederickii]